MQQAMQLSKGGNQSPQNASQTKGKSPFGNGKQPNSPKETLSKAQNDQALTQSTKNEVDHDQWPNALKSFLQSKKDFKLEDKIPEVLFNYPIIK